MLAPPPERRVYPAARRAALGLPDESGVPIGIAARLGGNATHEGSGAPGGADLPGRLVSSARRAICSLRKPRGAPRGALPLVPQSAWGVPPGSKLRPSSLGCDAQNFWRRGNGVSPVPHPGRKGVYRERKHAWKSLGTSAREDACPTGNSAFGRWGEAPDEPGQWRASIIQQLAVPSGAFASR